MRNIKLTIEYVGTDYAGWQHQNSTRLRSRASSGCPPKLQRRRTKLKTIQGTIERILKKVLQEKIKLIGSGRTDSGVHAKAQVANFKTNSGIRPDKLQRALNSLLPGDIVISGIEETDLDFHARYQVKSKIYRYTLLNRRYPSARLRDFVYFYPYPLNVKAMKRQARLLLGRKDFKSFQASDKKFRDSIRTIKKLNIKKDNDFIYIDIEADGFLYNMVRNLVGTLIEIGKGRPIDIRKLMRSRDRRRAGPTVPPQGLCLLRVRY